MSSRRLFGVSLILFGLSVGGLWADDWGSAASAVLLTCGIGLIFASGEETT